MNFYDLNNLRNPSNWCTYLELARINANEIQNTKLFNDTGLHNIYISNIFRILSANSSSSRRLSTTKI